MTTQIQRRRGTTAQHSTFTGANGEVTVDTDKKTLRVHDGSTLGGLEVSKARYDVVGAATTLRTNVKYFAEMFSKSGAGVLSSRVDESYVTKLLGYFKARN